MSFLDFVLSVARTWGHIVIGIAVLFSSFLCCCVVVTWYHRIIEQLDELRQSGKLPPQP